MLFSRNKPRQTEPMDQTAQPGKEQLSAVDARFQNVDRQLCIDKLDEVLSGEKKGAIVKIYLENFKLMNDTFGYHYGEQLLKEITHYLFELSGGALYRYMGVEFVLVLEGYNYSRAMEVAEEITDRFYGAWTINGVDCICSICGGVIFYPGEMEIADDAMKMLDCAITESGVAGLNQFTVYDTTLAEKISRRQKIAFALKDAVKQENVKLRYRPTYCVPRKTFTRAECYMQLFVPELGVINANEFLSVAEDSGQICAIDYFVIERVCGFIRTLLDADKDFESIAVTISAVMFFQEQFIEKIIELMGKYGIPHGKLALELSENTLISSVPNVGIVMQELSDAGVELVLNDFGTGFSAINNILSLPADVLKLERLFVWQLETNPRSGHLIEGLIRIARNLGLKLIAEGVETDNQVKLLEQYQCAYEQGFFYSPTVDATELTQMLPNRTTE